KTYSPLGLALTRSIADGDIVDVLLDAGSDILVYYGNVEKEHWIFDIVTNNRVRISSIGLHLLFHLFRDNPDGEGKRHPNVVKQFKDTYKDPNSMIIALSRGDMEALESLLDIGLSLDVPNRDPIAVLDSVSDLMLGYNLVREGGQ